MPKTLIFGLIAIHTILAKAVSVFCSERLYGTPNYQDCATVWSFIASGDTHARLFVEQQLRTKPPQWDWPSIVDPRSPESRQDIVQVPKLWSHGTMRAWWIWYFQCAKKTGNCNIALLSFAHGGSWLSVSSSRWTDVSAQGSRLVTTCAGRQGQGGFSIVNSELPHIRNYSQTEMVTTTTQIDRYRTYTRLDPLPLARWHTIR